MMPLSSKRPAFSMLTAIVVIVLMSSVATLIMGLSGKMVKSTTAQYHKEQAALLAKSYTEYAIMTVMSNDRNSTGKCIQDIDGYIGNGNAYNDGTGYQVRVRIGFIGPNSEINKCSVSRRLGNPASNNELNIIVDVYVEYKDIDNPNLADAPWVTYHRRTLQKI